MKFSAVIAIIAVIIYFGRTQFPSLADALPLILLGIVAAAAYLAMIIAWRNTMLARNPTRRLYLKSLAIQRWVQYSSATTSTSELAIEAGKGLLAKGRISEELALSERPVTELALVSEFRTLAEEAARAVRAERDEARVVIAIDELDKIGSISEVRSLLRSVKGVLDPVGVVLLVSVSDEAVTHLGLGGLRGRDEISSTFTTTLQVPPLTRGQGRDLLQTAVSGLSTASADAIIALTGGNQREAVRLLDECIRRDVEVTPQLCAEVAESSEVREFAAALVNETTVGEFEKAEAFDWLHRFETSPPLGTPARTAAALAQWWPTWSLAPAALWPGEVAEEWRRLMVRSALRSELLVAPAQPLADDVAVEAFRAAFELSQSSAFVTMHHAKEVLGLFAGADHVSRDEVAPSILLMARAWRTVRDNAALVFGEPAAPTTAPAATSPDAPGDPRASVPSRRP